MSPSLCLSSYLCHNLQLTYSKAHLTPQDSPTHSPVPLALPASLPHPCCPGYYAACSVCCLLSLTSSYHSLLPQGSRKCKNLPLCPLPLGSSSMFTNLLCTTQTAVNFFFLIRKWNGKKDGPDEKNPKIRKEKNVRVGASIYLRMGLWVWAPTPWNKSFLGAGQPEILVFRTLWKMVTGGKQLTQLYGEGEEELKRGLSEPACH